MEISNKSKNLNVVLILIISIISTFGLFWTGPANSSEDVSENYDDMSISEILMSSATESVEEVIEERTTYTAFLGGWSYHFETVYDINGNEYEFNDTHNMVGFMYQDWVVAAYKNSYYDWSYMAAYNFGYEWGESFEYGVLLGVVYGYEEQGIEPGMKGKYMIGDFAPVIFPYVAYAVYSSDEMTIKPTIGLLGTALTLTFQIEY